MSKEFEHSMCDIPNKPVNEAGVLLHVALCVYSSAVRVWSLHVVAPQLTVTISVSNSESLAAHSTRH